MGASALRPLATHSPSSSHHHHIRPSQPSQQVPASNTVNSTVYALTHLADKIASPNYKEFVRILNILYAANGLPIFTVPEELLTTSTSAAVTSPASDVTVSTVALADLLFADLTPPQPASDQLPTESSASPLKEFLNPPTPASTYEDSTQATDQADVTAAIQIATFCT